MMPGRGSFTGSLRPDAVVVGSGPNGLAAAVTLARAGLRVHLHEAAATVGGGMRSAELTLPGFTHDVCSAVHPMALASPFFKAFGLAERIPFAVPEVSYAHALDDGKVALAYRSLERTAESLGVDGGAYRALFAPLVRRQHGVMELLNGALLSVPGDPLAALLLGIRALEQGSGAWNQRFRSDLAPALLTGVAAHSMTRLPSVASAAAGLVLGTLGHTSGWPVPLGGSAGISTALVEDFYAHGGEIFCNSNVTDLAAVRTPGVQAVLLDTSVPALAAIAGQELPAGYLRSLTRYRHGNAAAKVDFALAGPVPWTAPELRLAPTIHLGGTRAQIAAAEATVTQGRYPDRPYILLSQPGVVDPSRAPAGAQTLWAYTHVPAGSRRNMTAVITEEIERLAPGFKDQILASRFTSAAQLAEYNPNYVGGDIGSGAVTLRQLVQRPVFSDTPWRTPVKGLYLCSAATPPGPGVHGLAGWNAARAALRDIFSLPEPDLGATTPAR